MNKLKHFIKRNFESFTFYYRHLRYRIFLAVSLSIVVGLLDGFGLTMFLPLLQLVSGNAEVSGEALGNLQFLVDGFRAIGVELNLLNVLGIMVVFFFAKGIGSFINASYRIIIQQHFIKKLRMEMLEALNRLRYKYFVTADVGRIQNTVSGEVERVSRSFQNYFYAAEQGVLVVVYMGFAFFVDAQFALLVTVGGVLTNYLYQYIYKKTKETSKQFTTDSHSYQGQIIQHVAHFKYLKATALQGRYAEHLEKSIHNIEKSRRYMGILNAIVAAAREPILVIIVALVIVVQAYWLEAPLAPILVSLLFFYRALSSLINMQNSWNRFLEVSGSLANVMTFQEEVEENKERTGNIRVPKFQRELQLEKAGFKYDDTYVLKDVSIRIPKNQTTAWVGESGSGKTTTVNILAGLMPLDKGQFYIDGQEAEKIDMHSYQKRIGYITQEPVIFNDTVFNNVAFWDDPSPANRERARSALNKAAILHVVEQMPKQMDSVLGHSGINLSGGQKQRISIARELYKDIDILIMDEATSSLDSETELAIQKSIEALQGEYTLLIVAHRLSTIKHADQIILMREGRVESAGSYSELVHQNINFKRMVELQEI